MRGTKLLNRAAALGQLRVLVSDSFVAVKLRTEAQLFQIGELRHWADCSRSCHQISSPVRSDIAQQVQIKAGEVDFEHPKHRPSDTPSLLAKGLAY